MLWGQPCIYYWGKSIIIPLGLRILRGLRRLLFLGTNLLKVDILLILMCIWVELAATLPLILFLTVLPRWLWSFCGNQHRRLMRSSSFFLNCEEPGHWVAATWDWLLLWRWGLMQNAASFLFIITNRGPLVSAALINYGVFIRPLYLESSWLLILECLTLLKDVINFGLQHFLLSQCLMRLVHVDFLIIVK